MAARERVALGFYSATELLLVVVVVVVVVVAITTLAVDTHHMLASTAAALVGAAMVSTLACPGARLRRGRLDPPAEDEAGVGAARPAAAPA
jgi:hypothetical protein